MLSVRVSICVCLVTLIDAARILTYIPTPSISHQVVFRPLTQELARRGHEVVVVTTDPFFPKGKTPPNLTEIDVHDVSYKFIKEVMEKSIVQGHKDDFMSMLHLVFGFVLRSFDKQLSMPEVREVIFGNQTFDLLILEACAKETLALSHIFKAPVIFASSLGPVFGNKEAIGAPKHPILYPTPMRQRIYNLSFWEKLKELYNHFKANRIFQNSESDANKMLQKHFGKDLPPISELWNNIDMLFLNVHPIFEGNHPVPPNVIYMWGIHKKEQKELPQDIKSYLDSSKNGVIYVSFGSNVDPTRFPPQMIKKFLKVFCDLPYDVLWKWNADELPGRCSNIKIGKWFPQPDLLRHPKIKLFITQGGLQSTDEAINAGVPLVGIPMVGDQWYNVEKYVEFKIGVHVDGSTFTEEILKDAIITVINDESYRKNIERLKVLMSDDPLPPLERAVWWTEYVIRHKGAKHLRSPAANISWAQYLELEFVLTLLSGLLLLISLAVIALYKVYSFVSKKYFKDKKLKVK